MTKQEAINRIQNAIEEIGLLNMYQIIDEQLPIETSKFILKECESCKICLIRSVCDKACINGLIDSYVKYKQVLKSNDTIEIKRIGFMLPDINNNVDKKNQYIKDEDTKDEDRDYEKYSKYIDTINTINKMYP